MKKILFATDFSKTALNAYQFALNFAEVLSASITTIHVYDPPKSYSSRLPHTSKEIEDLAINEEFENYTKESQKRRQIETDQNVSEVEVNNQLKLSSDIAKTITDTAFKDDFDLIVMGTEGASSFKKFFLGTITSKVIENAKCPVLCIPSNATFTSIDKIAYATRFDFNESYYYRSIIKFAEQFKASLNFVHISNESDFELPDYIKESKFNLKDKDISFDFLSDASIQIGLERYIKSENIKLLIMTTKQRGFLQKVLLDNSLTVNMSNYSSTPILALHYQPNFAD